MIIAWSHNKFSKYSSYVGPIYLFHLLTFELAPTNWNFPLPTSKEFFYLHLKITNVICHFGNDANWYFSLYSRLIQWFQWLFSHRSWEISKVGVVWNAALMIHIEEQSWLYFEKSVKTDSELKLSELWASHYSASPADNKLAYRFAPMEAQVMWKCLNCSPNCVCTLATVKQLSHIIEGRPFA